MSQPAPLLYHACMHDTPSHPPLHYAQALLWRQWLLKRRSLGTTVVELLSPIILISLLVRDFVTGT